MTANSLALISTDSISNLSTESNSEIQIFKESQLDVLQELLDFIDEYLIINKAISTKAKKGYIDLAHAKYAMGPWSITKDQIPSGSLESGILLYRDDSGTIQRDSDLEQVKNQAKNQVKNQAKNPLYWYGGPLSLPGSLRKCQQAFKETLDLVIQLLNVKIKINQLTDTLIKLSQTD